MTLLSFVCRYVPGHTGATKIVALNHCAGTSRYVQYVWYGTTSMYHTIIHTTGGVKPSRERAFNLCMENDGWLPAAGNLPKFSWGVSDFVEFFCPSARTKEVEKGVLPPYGYKIT